MSGTQTGGRLSRDKLTKADPNFYRKLGALGGRGDRGNKMDKGFATMDKLKHREASAKGGRISRRGK